MTMVYLGYENFPSRQMIDDSKREELVRTFQKNSMPFIAGCIIQAGILQQDEQPLTLNEDLVRIGKVYT